MSEEFIDLIENNHPPQAKVFHYKVGEKKATVLAVTSTTATAAMKQQFPKETILYEGVSDIILQVNDIPVIDI